jgi:hypothetical protein
MTDRAKTPFWLECRIRNVPSGLSCNNLWASSRDTFGKYHDDSFSCGNAAGDGTCLALLGAATGADACGGKTSGFDTPVRLCRGPVFMGLPPALLEPGAGAGAGAGVGEAYVSGM